MEPGTPNNNIACGVGNCKYNDSASYCTLSKIKVDSHSENPQECSQVDCESFSAE